MRQGVVLPQSEWDALAADKGSVVGTVPGKISYQPVPSDSTGAMQIATADVTLTYDRASGSDGETSNVVSTRVSVQVLCGPGSVPTPGSAQRAGDCKVVRFFTTAMEP